MVLEITILFILLALSGFFSASEVAFISLSQAKVDAMVKRKMPRANLIKKLKHNSRRLLITILVGNNIVNIAAASLATIIASKLFSSSVIGLTTGIMTFLVLVFGEILPKSYGANHIKRFVTFSVVPLRIFGFVIFPIVFVFEKMFDLLTGKPIMEKVSEDELKALALAGKKQGTIEKDELYLLNRIFTLNDITAEDIMTPRVQVEYVKDNMKIEEVADVIANKTHTRFPVIHGTSDEVLGFVHSRDVLLAFSSDKEGSSIKDIIRPIVKVPKQLKIGDLMKEFQKKKTHMAVVLDEYGGTEGIVTLEDVVEELVGEIIDEHDLEPPLIKRIDQNTVVCSGETDIRDINDFLNINLSGDPFDSIAEIILDKMQKIPKKGMEIEFDYIKCVLQEVNKKTIKKVKITKL